MKTYTIVVKLGTSSLVDEVTREPRIANMALIVETLVKLRRKGHRIVLVSSGAIAFGMKRMALSAKPARLAAVQALASIGQVALIGTFERLFHQLDQSCAQVLITRNDIMDYTQYKNATNTIHELLAAGVIPVVNENDTLSVSEIKFGDNDTLSAITAGMVHADYLFLMTDVACLYTDNPRVNPAAEPILVVDNVGELRLIAAELAANAGVTTIITLSSSPQYILQIVDNIEHHDALNLSLSEQHAHILREVARGTLPLHTRFLGLPQATAISSDRKFWLLHGLKTQGALVIDQGCYAALTRKNRAGLLPAGVVAVEGVFHESECVDLKVIPHRDSPLADAVPRGHCRVNYSSTEISLIKGLNSRDIEGVLGFADSEYVAHRDNIAFPPAQTADST